MFGTWRRIVNIFAILSKAAAEQHSDGFDSDKISIEQKRLLERLQNFLKKHKGSGKKTSISHNKGLELATEQEKATAVRKKIISKLKTPFGKNDKQRLIEAFKAFFAECNTLSKSERAKIFKDLAHCTQLNSEQETALRNAFVEEDELERDDITFQETAIYLNPRFLGGIVGLSRAIGISAKYDHMGIPLWKNFPGSYNFAEDNREKFELQEQNNQQPYFSQKLKR
jgi:hypothetical protein